MLELYARTPKQLDICLRLLYAEKIAFAIQVCESEKRKIFYRIRVAIDEQRFPELEEKYRILIS